MDVISLLFDYIFRDRSIPDSLRSLFGKLQVPIVKAALLDRSFFSDKKHQARQLLDHLAEAAVGATHDDAYQDAFAKLATDLVDEICRDFEIDVAVFRRCERKVQQFIDAERQKGARSAAPRTPKRSRPKKTKPTARRARAPPRQARGARRSVRSALLHRNDLGRLPGRARLATRRRRRGMARRSCDSRRPPVEPHGEGALAQKARLAKLVPGMIRNLRAGAAAVNVGDERVKPLLDAMYQLHMAAIDLDHGGR